MNLIDEAYEMLKSLEWCADGLVTARNRCPQCDGKEPNHQADCELSDLLSKLLEAS